MLPALACGRDVFWNCQSTLPKVPKGTYVGRYLPCVCRCPTIRAVANQAFQATRGPNSAQRAISLRGLGTITTPSRAPRSRRWTLQGPKAKARGSMPPGTQQARGPGPAHRNPLVSPTPLFGSALPANVGPARNHGCPRGLGAGWPYHSPCACMCICICKYR